MLKIDNVYKEYENFTLNIDELIIKRGAYFVLLGPTGSGKTLAALGCISEIINRLNNIIIIIACPYNHLIQQWKKEIYKFNLKIDKIIIADSTNPKWRNELSDGIFDVLLGYKNTFMAITTHRTFSSSDFKKIIEDPKLTQKSLLVVDEVHGLGTAKGREKPHGIRKTAPISFITASYFPGDGKKTDRPRIA